MLSACRQKQHWHRPGYLLVAIVALFPMLASARASQEKIKELGVSGTPLTPMGAIRAGNDDGSIPTWEGGILAYPDGYEKGDFYVDPFAADEKLFTITSANYKQYETKLSPGQRLMFERYSDTFKMHVYPSRRSASYPQRIYEGTIASAASVSICSDNERCLEGTLPGGGVPFPIPSNGLEAMWNHSLYYYGDHYEWTGTAFIVTADGKYVPTTLIDRFIYNYYLPESKQLTDPVFTKNGGALFCRSEEILSPPKSAGQIFGGCNYKANTAFEAYIYIPGQRRVRRAPEIGFYDQPGTGTDGLRTTDARTMFGMTGENEWYDYSLLGRTDMYVPYNTYKLARPEYRLSDIVRPHHVNPELVRYELHRVWVVEATLRDGFRHVIPKRTVYLDEDSWAATHADMYDREGKLWRYAEAFLINFYDVPMVSWWGDAHYDFPSGRYNAVAAWFNETRPPNFDNMPNPAIMTPGGLRKFGLR